MNSPVMFGEWLRQRRDALGLTRKEFAKRVGCSVSTLRKIENDERRPSGQIAELMANCLDIPTSEHSTFVRVARGELNVDRLLLPSNLVPHPSISSPKTNLPILPTPLIGRQDEVDELIRLLHDPQCRLLTLVGPGGIGKTRLAIETASRMQDSFADGTCFIPFASVNSIRFIVPMIADSVGFSFQSTATIEPKEQLFNHLKEKQILLLADNLEHLLIEPGIELFSELLAAAPKVKLLVTSRESLELQGEWIFEVQGLPIPESNDSKESTQNTSVELFLQRARRVHVGFNATAENYPAIIRICQLVNGTPLGIELAAAWVRTLSCDEIAKEIERGMDFLSVTTRDIPARHRSMRAVFDHSWKLLSEEEQAILLQLSVFRGGFQREAAEHVAGAKLSALSTLVTKSLVQRSGDNRYDLHELIRQFAAEQFANRPEEQAATHVRHGNYYLTYFVRAEARLRSSAQRETLAELTVEMDNFRAAWDWAITRDNITSLCKVSPALWHLFELRTWLTEGETFFHNAAEIIQSRGAQIKSDEANLLAVHIMRAHSAYFSFRLGKSAAAYAALLPSVKYLRSSADQLAGTYALWYLGIVCWELGRFAEANQSLQESLEKARACDERWWETLISEFIGIVAHATGEYDQACQYLTGALTGAREMGDPMLIAHVLVFLSQTIVALGQTAKARNFLRESLSIAQEIGYRHGIGRALDGLGQLAQITDPNEARVLFAASCDVFREMGDLGILSVVLCHQGYNLLALGNVADAQNSFIQVLRLARQGGYVPFALDALAGLASLQIKRGNVDQAFELLLIVLDHPAGIRETKDRAARLRAELEAQLTPSRIEAVLTHAGEKTLESVVEYLLK